RLAVAGWTGRPDFAGDAFAALYGSSGGVPRRLTVLAGRVLLQAAVEGGRAAFKVHCVQCHGSGAAGAKGYPNLNDDDWLWGGDLAT
ncbi:c-type cytochrome, partial [Mycobacterium tuberculosis]|nr:c-type cytochrome [Mycobacterium tuberculosis]